MEKKNPSVSECIFLGDSRSLTVTSSSIVSGDITEAKDWSDANAEDERAINRPESYR